MKNTRDFFAIAAIAIGLTLPIKVVSAEGLPPGQLPELTGEWWQWALSIPASVNPNLVQTGDDTCMIGQRGPIWFLAGVLNGGSAVRTCSVPEGNSLFFPVINYVNFYSPQCPPLTGKTVKELRDYIQPFIKGIHDVSVTFDGQHIKKTLLRLVISDPFELALPPNNVFGCPAVASSRCRILRISSAAEPGGAHATFPRRVRLHCLWPFGAGRDVQSDRGAGIAEVAN